MTPKRHAIAKEIIKLLYPGPPFGNALFYGTLHFSLQFSLFNKYTQFSSCIFG